VQHPVKRDQREVVELQDPPKESDWNCSNNEQDIYSNRFKESTKIKITDTAKFSRTETLKKYLGQEIGT